MRFGPDDEAAYYEARDQLIDDFSEWAAKPDVTGDHAETLLDFKWGYKDGDLLTWHVGHLDEFFVDWMPRKVLLPDEMIPDVVTDIAAFFAYLAESGRLGTGSDPAPRLIALTNELGTSLGTRMNDPARWSMGTALFKAMEADGVDPGDQSAMDAWTSEFNAGPLHHREAVLGPAPRVWDDEPVLLAPRPRPDPVAVNAGAAGARILEQMLALSTFLDAGRPLTKKGNLKLADARALVELLGTGDEVETAIGDRKYELRSAADLPRLDTIVQWAKAARVVRVVKGSMQGTASFRKLARDPVAGLDRLVDALLDSGPLLIHRQWVVPGLESVELFTDAAVMSMLTVAYDTDNPLDFEHLVAHAAEQVSRFFDLPSWLQPESIEGHVRHGLVDAFRGLQDAGIVVHQGGTEREERYGSVTMTGGTITLTPYGVATVQRIAPAWNFDAPVLDPFDTTAADEPVVVVRALRAQLDAGGPAALVAAFETLGPAGTELVATAWKIDGPAVLPVLEALGRHHLDKPTAKAARKAVLRHRSWLANRR